MDLDDLRRLPSWHWPEGTGAMLLDILGNKQASEADRLLAADLAGNMPALDSDLARGLLIVIRSNDEPDELRSTAAISLGPALENADMMGFDDPEEEVIDEELFHEIQATLKEIYYDTKVPKDVRRSILEASVRAPQDWHQEVVKEVYSSDDEDWRLTAVFCMGYVSGFDEQIMESLHSDNPDIHYHAVCAAGNWEVDTAWPHIVDLVTDDETDQDLRLAAIDAISTIRPADSLEILDQLTSSDDEEIVDAAYEAMAMAKGFIELDKEDNLD